MPPPACSGWRPRSPPARTCRRRGPPPRRRLTRRSCLSNGTVVPGEIVEDPATGAFRLKATGGTVVYEKSRVLKAAGSIEELYQYRVERLAPGDPDERIKLARWCLTAKLNDQAREQLLAVQAMCPDDRNVKLMLFNLGATSEKPAGVDSSIRRTSGDAPSPLDPRVVQGVRKKFNALPEIFDLPPGQAVPRAGEFTKYVQPILLLSCARCHNESYPGTFQLVEIKNSKDAANPDIPRANLDATLRLVNPDDPSRSELLSAGLVPHGSSKSAVFTGPNDRRYQTIVTWVKRLRPNAPSNVRTAAPEPVSRTGFNPTLPAPGDNFAADRVAPEPIPGPRPIKSAGLPALPRPVPARLRRPPTLRRPAGRPR